MYKYRIAFHWFCKPLSRPLLILLRASLCPILSLIPPEQSFFSSIKKCFSDCPSDHSAILVGRLGQYLSEPEWSWASFPCYLSQSCGSKPICLLITAELGIMYCTLFKSCSWNRMINFLAGLISVHLCKSLCKLPECIWKYLHNNPLERRPGNCICWNRKLRLGTLASWYCRHIPLL